MAYFQSGHGQGGITGTSNGSQPSGLNKGNSNFPSGGVPGSQFSQASQYGGITNPMKGASAAQSGNDGSPFGGLFGGGAGGGFLSGLAAKIGIPVWLLVVIIAGVVIAVIMRR